MSTIGSDIIGNPRMINYIRGLASQRFVTVPMEKYNTSIFHVLLVYSLLVIIVAYLLSHLFITFVLFTIPYAATQSYKAIMRGNQSQSQIWMFYWIIIGSIVILDPILEFIVLQLAPIHGPVKLVFVVWLQRGQCRGTRRVYDLIFKQLANIKPDQLKQEIEDTIEKVSRKNF